MKKELKVLGLMSGSSLDGLDIAYCFFDLVEERWKFELLETAFHGYPHQWQQSLGEASTISGRELSFLDSEFAAFMGNTVNSFIISHGLKDKVDFIASHGHTVFHFPEEGFTTQIGNGAILSAKTELPVICDFRSGDIALGGQGTPMVAVADYLLFEDTCAFINLGGIANMSIRNDDKMQAFDVCVANQVLNKLSLEKDKPFDEDGKMAGSGKLYEELLKELNQISYYAKGIPKSLDNSFSHTVVFPLIDKHEISVEDKLRTYCEHIAIQIIEHLEKYYTDSKPVMLCGGGALNNFLVDLIIKQSKYKFFLPSKELIEFKEALSVAFSGALRWLGLNNFMSATSGASLDSSNGAVYDVLPKIKGS